MTMFNARYTPNGINIYNYDYDYDHLFIGYSKREIKKLVRETLEEMLKIENVNDQKVYFIKNKYLRECGLLNEKKCM